MRPGLLALALWAMVPLVLSGQVVVSAERDLDFGVVFRGVPSTVDPTDAVKAGRIVVTTPRNVQFRVSFSVPTLLQGNGSATMPISQGWPSGRSPSRSMPSARLGSLRAGASPSVLRAGECSAIPPSSATARGVSARER